jgi:DNA gyrase subunit A
MYTRNTPDKPHKKSARIGVRCWVNINRMAIDVYNAMVRFAQSWSMRYPLVDGQGHKGALTETARCDALNEARLNKLAEDNASRHR